MGALKSFQSPHYAPDTGTDYTYYYRCEVAYTTTVQVPINTKNVRTKF